MAAIDTLASEIKKLMDEDIASITEAKTEQLAANLSFYNSTIDQINNHSTAFETEKTARKATRTAAMTDFEDHYTDQIALLKINPDAALNSVQEIFDEAKDNKDALQADLDSKKSTLQTRIADKAADFGVIGDFSLTIDSNYVVVS